MAWIDRMGDLRIGTSGWHYDSWWGPFFPVGVKKRDALRYYASQFSAIELNAPFYRTPTPVAVRAWVEQTPDDFRFAWKASQFITHWKRLSERSKNSIALLESRLDILGRKAGPVLFQLPPQFEANRERLASFIAMLPKRRRYVSEFRHPSWYADPILGLLRERDVALCISDHHQAPAPWEITAHHVYLRPHGPGGRYRGSYRIEVLGTWARRIRRWGQQGHDVFCFFDNDQKSAAPNDARRLAELLAPRREPSGPRTQLPARLTLPRLHGSRS
jgi:uncharacterized protein YecE (DUF72 family)